MSLPTCPRAHQVDVTAPLRGCPTGEFGTLRSAACQARLTRRRCGIQNVYLQPFRCHVTGSKSTKGLGVPKAPAWCGDNQSQCVKGPKQVVVWHRKSHI